MRVVIKSVWLTTVVTLAVVAVVLSAARLTLFNIADFKQDIETGVEQALGQPLTIGDISASMEGFHPALRLTKVSMLDKQSNASVLFFDEIYIDIDLLASLGQGRPVFGNLTLVGLDLLVERDAEGKLRIAGVAGDFPAQDQPSDLDEALLQWFVSQDHLKLEQATVRWLDAQAKWGEQILSDLNFTLINQRGRNQVVGRGILPSRFGGKFDFAFDFKNANFVDRFDGDGYVRTAGVRLAPWRDALYGDAVADYAITGEVDVELWLSVQDKQLTRLDGQVRGRTWTLSAPQMTPLMFDETAFDVNWRKHDQAWDAQIRGLSLRGDQAIWQIDQATVRHLLDNQERQYEIALSTLSPQWLAAVAQRLPQLSDEWRLKLAKLQPQAQVRDVYVRWLDHKEGDDVFFARAEIGDFTVNHVDKIPGIQGVDGVLYVANDGWVFEAATQNASVTLEGLFRDPLAFHRFDGVVVGQHDKNGWDIWTNDVVFSNAHLQGSGYFSFLKPASGGSPELDLVVSIDQADGRFTSRYLPVGIMHENVVKWLDRSIVSGNVTSAGVTFRGPVKAFPFDNGQGRFEVQASVERGVLDYMPGWPRITNIDTQLSFNEQSMEIRTKSAKTVNAKLSDVVVGIPKFKAEDRALYIDGHATGSTADGLQFLLTSPLVNTVGAAFQHAEASGSSNLDLKLRIPLNAHETQIHLDGLVSFAQSSLIFKDLGVDLRQVDGELHFSETGIDADWLQGNVLGFDAQARIATEHVRGRSDIVVSAKGLAAAEDLFARFKAPVLGDMQGIVPWQGKLTLPKGLAPRLEIESSLAGVALNMPEPVGKAAMEIEPLQLELQFPLNAEHPLQLTYGDHVAGIFELASHDGGGVEMVRGEIRYGDGAARLPKGTGLRIAGKADVYDHTQWVDYLAKQETSAKSAESVQTSVSPKGSRLAEMELLLKEVHIFGQKAHSVVFSMVEAPHGLLAEIISPDVAGHVMIPYDERAPVDINLDYLFYKSKTGETARSVDEELDANKRKQKRPIRLKVYALHFDNVLLGRFNLEMNPQADGESGEIARADIDGELMTLRAQGAWTDKDGSGKALTRIDAKLDTGDMGLLLSQLGYAKSIAKGQAHNEFNLRWRGGVEDFALARLDGDVKFDIKAGELRDVSPGAGRVFGLLSVNALPRRLSLDFSDFFAQGMAFDSIKGTVKLNQGEAFTDDLKIDGPAANITITGYTDLVGKKYNQYVTVEPNFTGSLPLAIAVIANPAAGVAAWFAEKVLKQPVGDFVNILYHVSGSWEAPEVKRLGRLEYTKQQEQLLSTPPGVK